ncbi:hypothetical protein K2Q00_03485 [Patescibacteria group bacterium]|nr:hypothetical protein [Patescibacteria group bacterium]
MKHKIWNWVAICLFLLVAWLIAGTQSFSYTVETFAGAGLILYIVWSYFEDKFRNVEEKIDRLLGR